MTSPSDDLIEFWHRTADERSAEITRLRAELAEMEKCKNTYATLAYERQEQLFKLRAELAEVKRVAEEAGRILHKRMTIDCDTCETRVGLNRSLEAAESMWSEYRARAEQAEAARDRFAELIARNQGEWKIPDGMRLGLAAYDLGLLAARASAEAERKAHLAMTPDEYTAMSITGWHEVCRNVDGHGGVGVRFLGIHPGTKP